MGSGLSSLRSAGSKRVSLRPLWMTCVPSCDWPKGASVEPSAAIFDSRTLQSSPQSGHRAGYDGAKRRKGSKVHLAVDTLGYLLSLHITPANEQDRAEAGQTGSRRPGSDRRPCRVG